MSWTLCTFIRKQANVWSFWSIYVGNKPQQRLESCLRIDLEFKMAAKQNKNQEACSAAQPVHCNVYDRSASNHDQFFH